MGRENKPLVGWPYKVLIFCRKGLAEIVFAIPVVAALKKMFPFVRIEWLVSGAYKRLVEAVEGVDEAVEYPEIRIWPIFKPLKPLIEGFQIFFRFVLNLRRRLYAASIDVEDSPVCRWLARLAGIRLRIGRKGIIFCRWLNNYRIDVDSAGGHIVERNLRLLSGWQNVSPDDLHPKVVVPEDVKSKIDSIFERLGIKGKKFVVLHPGAEWESKKWSVAGFVEVAKYLNEKYNLVSLITWGTGERAQAWDVVSGAGEDAAIIAPEVDTLELAYLLSQSVCCVAPDTGVLHLASLMGTPVVGLYGPTNPELRRPFWGKSRVVSRYNEAKRCGTAKARNLPCPQMQEISAGEVVAAIEDLLELKS